MLQQTMYIEYCIQGMMMDKNSLQRKAIENVDKG